MRTPRSSTAALSALLVASAVLAPAASARDESSPAAPIDKWLVLGPVEVPLPAFHEESPDPFDASWLLDYRHLDIVTVEPAPGAVEVFPLAGTVRWVEVGEADTFGVDLDAASDAPLSAWLAAWISVPRWMKVDIGVRSTDPFELFAGGEQVLSRKSGAAEDTLDDRERCTVELARGKHLLLVKTVRIPGESSGGWRVRATVAPAEGFEAAVTASTDPLGPMTLSEVMDIPYARSIEVSPDGSLAAISFGGFTPPEGKRESWIEIRELPSGRLVRQMTDTEIGGIDWAPKGLLLSFTAGGALKVLDMESGEVTTIAERLEDLGGYVWSPRGDYVVYSLTEKPEPDKTGVKRHLGLYDRTDYGRNVSSLYIAPWPPGASRRVTSGTHSVWVHDIHPDGRRAIIGRSREELSERPFSISEIYILDLEEGTAEPLLKGRWTGRASYSPSGDRILVSGGPSLFGGAGRDLPEGVVPNDYDGQLYIYDPGSGEVEAITKDFDPAVNTAFWAPFDGGIYIRAEEGEYVRLYRYDPKKREFEARDLGVDVVGKVDFASGRAVAVFSGSSADTPEKVYSARLGSGRPGVRKIADYSEGAFENVELGKVETWDFVTSGGRAITGRIHYPPRFDESKRYPCIVYYYGGTSPVDRSFGGRYPKNLWAAHGYVVYVLQPSGATGFGQEWSARHVNEWGGITAGEIIEGAEKFLEAHEFVDPGRVGCIGASFGGFMTQLLVTRTGMFAAAVSHAGISMIPSYWGEGYWGYSYNAVAAAGSYPWNSPEVYIDQSPLFSADRITTPLLLLHGGADTNVPPGESEQMYTALKLLGREVEYLRFAGQNHFILDYDKRRIWNDAIISWFDRFLKDQPEWWNDMYPPGEEKDEEIDGEPPRMEPEALRTEELGTVLFGDIDRDFVISNLVDWDREYFEYEPDPEVLERLSDWIHGASFTVVLGTWCPDSRREVPRLWKVLESVRYPVGEVEMKAVGSSRFTTDMGIPSRYLEWSEAVKEHYGVERVATIIVYRDGEEIGRVVETPEGLLEEDLLEIVE